jgi:hypothetical protein
MSQQINDTGLRVVYYDALQAYDAGIREYTAIVRNAAVPAGAAVVAAAPVIVAVPPIIGSGAMSTAVAMNGSPPPLAAVSAVVTYDPNAPRSPGMTPMAATPSVSNAPQMRRFTATGKELPTNEFPTDFNPSWITLP